MHFLLACFSCHMLVHVGGAGIVVHMLRPVRRLWFWPRPFHRLRWVQLTLGGIRVDKRVHFGAYSQCAQVGNGKDV